MIKTIWKAPAAWLCAAALLWALVGSAFAHIQSQITASLVDQVNVAIWILFACLATVRIRIVLNDQRDPTRQSDQGPDRVQLGMADFLRSLGVAAFAFGPVLLNGLYLTDRSQAAFEAQRHAFLHDPQGFAAVRAYALENFGKTLVLGSKSSNWANTTLRIPNASGANMAIQAGYCLLGFNEPSFSSTFSPPSEVDPALWQRGILMHEFGHCLDVSRDLPPPAGGGISHWSIAPQDSGAVHDLDSYLAVEDRRSTVLWREVFADVFAIGYWRLNDAHAAPALADALYRKRKKLAGNDEDHATMCWLQYAASDRAPPLPATNHGLLAWADAARSTAPCKVKR
ncbi:hypothetical protein WI40_14740 [Burkholderia ubonensis]|uniref:hypothetical protein n=1 Tax=Burkholderia ubonensis TaxID=101571 RepID=UPI00075348A4|nr:hypothetical protein [Burkholderia ubonensis]KUZ97531.1 hypothetical protein WI40_14740 [Burkholderia ubonensis]